MILLGFDTATPSTAVGLLLADGSVLAARDDPQPGEHPGHATRLLAMAGELLEEAGLRWGELERIAAGVGPGTFTGLRVGVSTARGLAQSLSAELAGVSSLRALAAAAFDARTREDDGEVEAVIAVIDARRGEVFAAAYAPGEGTAANELASELLSPRALAPQDLSSFVALAEEHLACGGQRWLALGDGATRFREYLQIPRLRVPPDSSPQHIVSGEAICELGARAAALSCCEELVPDYGRRPDAEIALEGAAAGKGLQP
ncbi:MAG: tRNA (adenosine(37)-N6)-threonylcarbamoyltransferase complex dimerization subunit type 1 TsaB [Solirubrobacteraceae bacterium]